MKKNLENEQKKVYCYNLALIRKDGNIETDCVCCGQLMEQMTIDNIADKYDCDVQAVLFGELTEYDDSDVITLVSDKERKKNVC